MNKLAYIAHVYNEIGPGTRRLLKILQTTSKKKRKETGLTVHVLRSSSFSSLVNTCNQTGPDVLNSEKLKEQVLYQMLEFWPTKSMILFT